MKHLNNIRGNFLDFDKILEEFKEKSCYKSMSPKYLNETLSFDMSANMSMEQAHYLDIFEYYQDFLQWQVVSRRPNLSEEFIRKFESKLTMYFVSIHSADNLIKCPDLIKKYKKEITPRILHVNLSTKLSYDKFLAKYFS